jgi:hypothetical protein
MLDFWKYDKLVTFVLAAEGGLNYASRCLDWRPLSQISTDLHSLEFFGGERLFHIHEDRLILTKAGKELFTETRPLLLKIYSIYECLESQQNRMLKGREERKSPDGSLASHTEGKSATSKTTKPWWRFW